MCCRCNEAVIEDEMDNNLPGKFPIKGNSRLLANTSVISVIVKESVSINLCGKRD